MTDKKEMPKVSFRCPEDYLERVDKLIKSDRLKFPNRSALFRIAVRRLLDSEEK